MPQLFERLPNRLVLVVRLQQSSQTRRLFSTFHFINGRHAPGQHLFRRLDPCDPARLLASLVFHNCPDELCDRCTSPMFVMKDYELCSIMLSRKNMWPISL